MTHRHGDAEKYSEQLVGYIRLQSSKQPGGGGFVLETRKKGMQSN